MSLASSNLRLSSAVNGNCYLPASTISEKYKVGKVIGDGNFAVVKECVERWVRRVRPVVLVMFTAQLAAVCGDQPNETRVTCAGCFVGALSPDDWQKYPTVDLLPAVSSLH